MENETPELEHLNTEIRQLRALYEQYFQGIERLEPLKKREDVKKLIRRLEGIRRNNTAFRFRLGSAKQTMVTYEQYWDRTTRQIENGTYKRDKFRAQRRRQAAEHANPKERSASRDDPPNDSVRELHRAYLRARNRIGDTRPVPIDSFAKTLEARRMDIRQKFRCENVEFRVSVKDGRAVLKATPR